MPPQSKIGSEATMDVESGSNVEQPSKRASFVDYVPPPPKPLPPPAKYKLWLLIMVSVYFADWFSTEAGMRQSLADRFNLSFNTSLLIVLACIVGILIYGTLELMIMFVKIKIGDTVYGIGPWLKLPRTRWVHEYDNFFVKCVGVIVHIFEEGFSLFSPAPPPPKPAGADKPKLFEPKEEPVGDITLRVESHIKADAVDKYHNWEKRFIQMGCHARPGMKEVESSESPDGKTHVTLIHFANVDALNEYMSSPVRQRVVRQLEPMLDSPTLLQMREERVLPDAFSDTCTPQGHPVPKLAPKKWKVWTLTTMGLWFAIVINNETLPHYYKEMGLTEAHDRAYALVRVIVNTFCNVYIYTPFLTMIFGNWLKRKEDENDTDEPWRTLNDGFKYPLRKAIPALGFYGGCLLAWIIKAN